VSPRRLAAISTCALLAAACGGTTTRTVTAPGAPGAPAAGGISLTELEQGYVSVIARVSDQVVQISNPQGLGSGVVFDTRGDVVTNAHVVAGGGPFKVTDSRGHSYSATLVGAFAPDDLAVIRTQGASLHAASFANSGQLKIGDIVLAIGNPLGLRSSVTEGIISALGRTVPEGNGVVLPNVIQTSASINPGNSGGALVDLGGQVVGIPTLAATDPQLGGGAAPGIGFAIPSSVVKDIAGQIVRNGHVVNSHRAFLGVDFSVGLGAAPGALVAAVQPGGPAARAGIAPGDAIISIGRQPISTPDDVSAELASLSPGQTVPMHLVHQDGSQTTVQVTLGQYPGRAG
jgi:S1-C subfamily serine protease